MILYLLRPGKEAKYCDQPVCMSVCLSGQISDAGDKSASNIFTHRISEGGNAMASVRLSVRLFPINLRNRLTTDLELLHVSRS